MSAEDLTTQNSTTGSAPQVVAGAARDEELDDEALDGVAGGSLIGRLIHTGEKATDLLRKRS
ncbi:hypothetical protein FDO65_00535 [Nakamurella flava]|uniref:Uncharacterized protein n=1 Tax=Nakamurella flava TaxID=2576308 RepID=A0A4U6QIM3_9ACTN|nr:hypothetical protein [Nakamurella flava]TKV60257.1 hypothetical protein FDO65_00535 [Nakamurella flava]